MGPAATGDRFGCFSLSPMSGWMVRHLAELEIDAPSMMNGPPCLGDCRVAIHGPADDYDRRIGAL